VFPKGYSYARARARLCCDFVFDDVVYPTTGSVNCKARLIDGYNKSDSLSRQCAVHRQQADSAVRISAYVQAMPDPNQRGAVALNVFCPSAIGTVEFQLLVKPGDPAFGGVSQTAYLATPNASSSCIYWIDFDGITDSVDLNVYLTVEKI
jgi:hypothetical protein